MSNLDSLRDWGYVRDTSDVVGLSRSVQLSVQSVQNSKRGAERTWPSRPLADHQPGDGGRALPHFSRGVPMNASENASSQRYFRQGEMVVPDLCFHGLPGCIYTDATCLTALLLLHEHDMQCLEESCKSLFTVLNLFHYDVFNAIIHGRLFHHHHNPTLAGIMAQIGYKTIVILPDPVTIFSNLLRGSSSPSRELGIVESCLNLFKDWLEMVSLYDSCSHFIVLQARDIASNPVPIANALARLGLIHVDHSQARLDRLCRCAKFMALEMMEVCYGIEARFQPEIAPGLRQDQEARIRSLIEQYPIANEIKELHREVARSLQVC
jgi:hypothetical protein